MINGAIARIRLTEAIALDYKCEDEVGGVKREPLNVLGR